MPAPPADEEFDLVTVGGRIRYAYRRRPAGALSRNEFAQKLGAHYPHVMRWESNTQIPGGRYLGKIAELCGTTVDWLMRGGADPFPAVAPSDPAADPPYPAWADFLEALPHLVKAGVVSPAPSHAEIEELRRERWKGRTPTVETYRVELEALRSTVPAEDLEEGHRVTEAAEERAAAKGGRAVRRKK